MWGPAEVMKMGKMKKRCEGNFIKKLKIGQNSTSK